MGGAGNGFCVSNFNDDETTTKAKLLSKWDAAIKLAKDALKKATPKK